MLAVLSVTAREYRSVSGSATFLEGAHVTVKCHIQGSTSMAVTEEEKTWFHGKVFESIGLKVKLR